MSQFNRENSMKMVEKILEKRHKYNTEYADWCTMHNLDYDDVEIRKVYDMKHATLTTNREQLCDLGVIDWDIGITEDNYSEAIQVLAFIGTHVISHRNLKDTITVLNQAIDDAIPATYGSMSFDVIEI